VRGWTYLNQLEQNDRGYDDATYSSMDDPRRSGTYRIDDETWTRGATLHTSYDLTPRSIVTLGLLGRREDYEADGEIRDVPHGGGGGGGTTYDLRGVDEDWATRTYTAALEWAFTPIEPVDLVLSYAQNRFDPDSASHDVAGSYLVGAAWQATGSTRLRTSFGRRNRFPSIRQLYDIERGNPDLRTESSRVLEVGVEQGLPGNSRIAITSFVTWVDDFIERSELTDLYENSQEFRYRGFEVSGETRFWPQLLVRVGYAYLDTEDRSDGAERDEIQNLPRHRVSLDVRYHLESLGVDLQGSVLRVADAYIYERTDLTSQASMDDYTRVDLKLSKDLLRGRAAVYLAAMNLFDEGYQEEYGFPEPGRTLRFGAEYRF
jgi:outer membrane cobalamin receptor